MEEVRFGVRVEGYGIESGWYGQCAGNGQLLQCEFEVGVPVHGASGLLQGAVVERVGCVLQIGLENWTICSACNTISFLYCLVKKWE